MSIPAEMQAGIAPRPAALARARARVAGLLASRSHDAIAKRVAGTAFLIRAASAVTLFASQIFFARWMGGAEFGVYVYVWTWALMIGDVLHLGLSSVAPRFIPQYGQMGRIDLLRGFIATSCGLVFTVALGAAALAAAAIAALEPLLAPEEVWPLTLATLALPAYALSVMLDGIARSYNRVGLALAPPFILRPLLILAFVALAHLGGSPIDAGLVVLAAVVASWGAMAVQLAGLAMVLARVIEPGPRARATGDWFAAALPVLIVLGFYTLLSYTDVIVLRQYAPASELAAYYAATKTLALVAIVYFSVGAAVAHRFSEYLAAGDKARLADFVAKASGWTFWPSLAACAAVLALGWPILWLFGDGFTAAYPAMFVLALGLLARASVGPAERLLNMTGQQRICAMVYGLAFAANLGLCLVLVPRFGMMGAAASTASAIILESSLLARFVRTRLGLSSFILAPSRRRTTGAS